MTTAQRLEPGARPGMGPVLNWLADMAGETVWVLTHEGPDGDAIGALLGARELLVQFGARAVAMCADPAPRIYEFLLGLDSIRHELPTRADAGDGNPRAILYVDCGDASRAGRLAPGADARALVVNIDHHRSNTMFGGLNWVDVGYSSTAEMLATLFMAAGKPFGPARDPLYTGIVTDTGSFAYEGTSAHTHEVTAALVAAGASPSQLYDHIYNSRESEALALIGAAIASLRLSAGGRIALLTLGPEDFARTGARREHTEGIVNYARSLAGVQVGILLYSVVPGIIHGSVRSRPGVPADRLAGALGGGGHPRAAGFRLSGDLPDAISRVLLEAERHLIEQ